MRKGFVDAEKFTQDMKAARAKNGFSKEKAAKHFQAEKDSIRFLRL